VNLIMRGAALTFPFDLFLAFSHNILICVGNAHVDSAHCGTHSKSNLIGLAALQDSGCLDQPKRITII